MAQVDILLAGAVAAFTVDLIVFPLDTLKTRVQAKSWTTQNTSLLQPTDARPKALFRGLYQGLGVVILATLPASGAFFITYEQSKKILSSIAPSSVPQPLVHAFASGIAEAASCAILTPAEVIKQNAQVSTANSSTTTSASTYRALRSRGIFRGYNALLFRNLPFTALQFPLFEHFRPKMSEEDSITSIGLWAGLSAGCAGSIAAVVTTPLDVVKTRIMLRKEHEGKEVSGLVMTAREILKSDGPRGLWRGGALRGAWTFLGSGLYLGFYEGSKVYFTRKRDAGDGSLVDGIVD